jgi:SAM-dependent methyltransferase
MEKLYTELADVYEAMYRTLMDYDAEFACYGALLKKYGVSTVLEIGCGAGNLAQRLLAHGYDYTGMDISSDMLAIARRQLPPCPLVQGDMRSFRLDGHFDGALIVGRSLSYLLENRDIRDTFESVHAALSPGGILIFDIIDAQLFIPGIDPGQTLRHEAAHEGRRYVRDSIFTVNAQNGWSWDWAADYYEEDASGARRHLASDHSTLRTFTIDEMEIFLNLSGFEVLEHFPKRAYTFDTEVFVSKKV